MIKTIEKNCAIDGSNIVFSENSIIAGNIQNAGTENWKKVNIPNDFAKVFTRWFKISLFEEWIMNPILLKLTNELDKKIRRSWNAKSNHL